MTDFLILSDGFAHTKFIPIFDGFTGKPRLAVQGFQGATPAEHEFIHQTTHGRDHIEQLNELTSMLLAREGIR